MNSSDARGRVTPKHRWPLLSAQPKMEKREDRGNLPALEPRWERGRNGAEVIQARTVSYVNEPKNSVHGPWVVYSLHGIIEAHASLHQTQIFTYLLIFKTTQTSS